MTKVHIIIVCDHCNGQAYLPMDEADDHLGQKYIRYQPCLVCEGSGQRSKWISLGEFATLLSTANCPHNHFSLKVGFHSNAGDISQDIQQACDDCGLKDDLQTLRDCSDEIP